MFNSGFAENLLEKIGKGSAALVLDKQGHCVFANKATEEVLGMLPDEIAGQNFTEIVRFNTLEDQPVSPEKNPVFKALDIKDYVQSTPFFCKISDSTETETLALNTMQYIENDEIVYVIVQLRKAKREVQVGEMKSLFLSFAAHQLKTPSSVVKGFLELMMRQGEAAYSAEQWHFLTSAFESNEQLIEVSKTLLNMARLEGGLIEPNIQTFDPNRALQSKIASLAPMYRTKRVSVNLSSAGNQEVGELRTDQTFFLEIFGILLGNAIKHSSIGGDIMVSCVLSNAMCKVHVIDNGPGISQAIKDTLFKSQQDSSENDNSHGLGLFMAKKYINILGGTIGIADSETGSDFYFTVPNIPA
jgi:signal transduction histidine kinase